MPADRNAASGALEYELPKDIGEAFHALVDKRFGGYITAEEERDLDRLSAALDEADTGTPLERARAEKATTAPKMEMSILNDIIRQLKYLMDLKG